MNDTTPSPTAHARRTRRPRRWTLAAAGVAGLLLFGSAAAAAADGATGHDARPHRSGHPRPAHGWRPGPASNGDRADTHHPGPGPLPAVLDTLTAAGTIDEQTARSVLDAVAAAHHEPDPAPDADRFAAPGTTPAAPGTGNGPSAGPTDAHGPAGHRAHLRALLQQLQDDGVLTATQRLAIETAMDTARRDGETHDKAPHRDDTSRRVGDRQRAGNDTDGADTDGDHAGRPAGADRQPDQASGGH